MSETEFKCGDTIIAKSGALVKLLKPEFKGKFCDNCFGSASGKVLTCSNCKLMNYCNQECQRHDWKEAHKLECKSPNFRPLFEQGLTLFDSGAEHWARIILRMLAKYHLHPSAFNEKFPLYDGTTRSFMDMMDHVELIENDYGSLVLAKYLVKVFKDNDSSFGAVDFDAAFVMRLMGIWKINVFQLCNSDLSTFIGGGLFILHSALDHSCRPNAFPQRHENGQLEIRCIHPIAKGEKALVSYLDGFQNLKQRQSSLMEAYNFKCECVVCRTEESDGALINYNSPILNLGKDIREFTKVKDVIKARDNFLKLAGKVCNDNDDRILQVRMYLHYQLVYSDFRKNMDFLTKETTDLLKSILITYGKDSFHYRQFSQLYLAE